MATSFTSVSMPEEPKSSNPSYRAKLLLPLGILAISSASVLIKACDAPPLIIAAYRLSLASFLLSAAALPRILQEIKRFRAREVFLWLLAGIFLSFHFALWITSLQYTSVASSVVLVTTNPLFVGIASVLFLGERLSTSLFLSILIAILGGIIIAWGDWGEGPSVLYGDFLALGGAVMMTGYLLVGRRIRQKMPLHVYVSLVYGVAGVLLVLLALGNGDPFFGHPPKTYFILFLLAVLPQMIGHTTLNWALKFFSATLVAVVLLGEPIGATILAYLFLGETVTGPIFLGGALVLLGIYLSAREETKPRRI